MPFPWKLWYSVAGITLQWCVPVYYYNNNSQRMRHGPAKVLQVRDAGFLWEWRIGFVTHWWGQTSQCHVTVVWKRPDVNSEHWQWAWVWHVHVEKSICFSMNLGRSLPASPQRRRSVGGLRFLEQLSHLVSFLPSHRENNQSEKGFKW